MYTVSAFLFADPPHQTGKDFAENEEACEKDSEPTSLYGKWIMRHTLGVLTSKYCSYNHLNSPFRIIACFRAAGVLQFLYSTNCECVCVRPGKKAKYTQENTPHQYVCLPQKIVCGYKAE